MRYSLRTLLILTAVVALWLSPHPDGGGDRHVAKGQP